MGQIKWVLMNIDSIPKNIQDNMVGHGEVRRTINYLVDNDVNLTSLSGFHTKVAPAMASNFSIPVMWAKELTALFVFLRPLGLDLIRFNCGFPYNFRNNNKKSNWLYS